MQTMTTLTTMAVRIYTELLFSIRYESVLIVLVGVVGLSELAFNLYPQLPFYMFHKFREQLGL